MSDKATGPKKPGAGTSPIVE